MLTFDPLEKGPYKHYIFAVARYVCTVWHQISCRSGSKSVSRIGIVLVGAWDVQLHSYTYNSLISFTGGRESCFQIVLPPYRDTTAMSQYFGSLIYARVGLGTMKVGVHMHARHIFFKNNSRDEKREKYVLQFWHYMVYCTD